MPKIKDCRYTVRVYDLDLFEKLEDLYYKNASLFKSKNDFLVICLERGLDVVADELSQIAKYRDKREIERHLESKKSFNEIIELNNDLVNKMVISLKLLSNCYAMLTGLSEDEPKSVYLVNQGYYDKLPKRIAKELNR